MKMPPSMAPFMVPKIREPVDVRHSPTSRKAEKGRGASSSSRPSAMVRVPSASATSIQPSFLRARWAQRRPAAYAVDGISTLEAVTTEKRTCSPVGETVLDVVAGKLTGMCRDEDKVTLEADIQDVHDLADDVLVGEADNQTALGRCWETCQRMRAPQDSSVTYYLSFARLRDACSGICLCTLSAGYAGDGSAIVRFTSGRVVAADRDDGERRAHSEVEGQPTEHELRVKERRGWWFWRVSARALGERRRAGRKAR
jgi:hypothetical protein